MTAKVRRLKINLKTTDSVKFISLSCYGYQVVCYLFQGPDSKQSTQAGRKLMCFVCSHPSPLRHCPNRSSSCSEPCSAIIIGSDLVKPVIKHFAGSAGCDWVGGHGGDCSSDNHGGGERFPKARGGKLSNQCCQWRSVISDCFRSFHSLPGSDVLLSNPPASCKVSISSE